MSGCAAERKRIAGFFLALTLVMTLLCVSASAEEYPQPEGGKKFETNWAIFGMTVEIHYEEEGYRVYIKSSDPEQHQGTEWEYSCSYNEEQDALLSISSSKNSYTEDPATGDLQRGPFEYQETDNADQTTVFTIDQEGFLLWKDGRGQDGADLQFSNIGAFQGFWKSEDGKTYADISWCDSEEGDDYGYNVFLHDEGEDTYAEYSMHGLYDAATGKLTVTGPVTVYTKNAAGEYDAEVVPNDPETPTELIFSQVSNGKILLERENGIELIYDLMGGDSQG